MRASAAPASPSCGAANDATVAPRPRHSSGVAVNDLASGSNGATLATAAQVFLADARPRHQSHHHRGDAVEELDGWRPHRRRRTRTTFDVGMGVEQRRDVGRLSPPWAAEAATLMSSPSRTFRSDAADKIHINAAGALGWRPSMRRPHDCLHLRRHGSHGAKPTASRTFRAASAPTRRRRLRRWPTSSTSAPPTSKGSCSSRPSSRPPSPTRRARPTSGVRRRSS